MHMNVMCNRHHLQPSHAILKTNTLMKEIFGIYLPHILITCHSVSICPHENVWQLYMVNYPTANFSFRKWYMVDDKCEYFDNNYSRDINDIWHTESVGYTWS